MSEQKDAPRRWWQRRPAPSIRDVPCASCLDGYGGSHSCACDRTKHHDEPPRPLEPAVCHEFIDTGRCGHSDAEHDALADAPIPPGEGKS